MDNAYLIVSDLHITEVEDHADGWMGYKSRRFVIDEDLAALVERFRADAVAWGGRALTLVLNGDIIDFDLVREVPARDAVAYPISGAERRYGLEPSEAKSVWKLQRILAQHPAFVDLLAGFVAAGHRVVYVLGNHDRELVFGGVQAVLRDAIVAAVSARGGSVTATEVIAFEPWFHYVADELYVEHGNQYDTWSSFRYVLATTAPDATGVEVVPLPMGNFANRYLLNRMGYFNPHAGDFLQSAGGYVSHWVRHYLFHPTRHLMLTWMWGSLLIFAGMLRNRRLTAAHAPSLHVQRRDALAARHALPRERLAALDALAERPVNRRLFPILRELWLDRAIMAVVMVTATIVLALAAIPLWLKLVIPLLVFPLAFLIYERFAYQRIDAYEADLPARARAIAALMHVPVVSFGHTHNALATPLGGGATFANSGTWAPSWVGGDVTQPTPAKRNYIVVDARPDGHGVRVGSWMG